MASEKPGLPIGTGIELDGELPCDGGASAGEVILIESGASEAPRSPPQAATSRASGTGWRGAARTWPGVCVPHALLLRPVIELDVSGARRRIRMAAAK
jgi:hypothetical protein